MDKKIIIGIVLLILAIGVIIFLQPKKGNNMTTNLEIKCDSKDLSGEYKEGDKINCELLGEEFTITVKNITNDSIKLTADKYGLFPERDNGTISLTDKVNEFTLTKDKPLVLSLQATDVNSHITITWK